MGGLIAQPLCNYHCLLTAGINAHVTLARNMRLAYERGPAYQNQILRRGDLVFWQGHVGIMQDHHRLLHANAYHMAVVSEPLEDAVTRISPIAGPITALRRVYFNHSLV